MNITDALTPIIHRDVEGEVRLSPFLCWPYDRIASPDTRDIVLLKGIVDLFTEARMLLETPLPVTSGYRTPQYQKELRKRGLKAAKISPHCHGAALDIDIVEWSAAHRKLGSTRHAIAEAMLMAFWQAGNNLDLRRYMRVGYRYYDSTFMHVDIIPILFTDAAEGLPKVFYPFGRQNPSPKNWKGGVTW